MATDSDGEMAYLSPSFDPATLTVPKLRSILLAHEISYPASAKKPQLLQLFNDELVPRSRKILAARSRVRRTSRGITDMPSSQEGTVDGEDDRREAAMLPPPVPDAQQRKSRKSSRQPSEGPPAEPTENKKARKSSSKHPRPSDTDASETEIKRPSARKTRRSEITPAVKVEEPSDKPLRPGLEKSPFSDENPFQSGSSPLAPSDSRPKSAGLRLSAGRRKSTSRRRKTDSITSSTRDLPPQQDGALVPSSKTFDVSIGQSRKAEEKEDIYSELEAGEEFTPEEQLELNNDPTTDGRIDSVPSRKKPRSQKSGGSTIPRSAPWAIITAVIAGYAIWFCREKREVGYCGVGRTSDSIAGVQIPDWASMLQPECELCPQHAYCYENMEIRCEADFVLKRHPLSLNGVIPLTPSCEPDGEKARRVKSIADQAVETLRERNAEAECGTFTDGQGKPIKSPEIDEETLKKPFDVKRRARKMSEEEFQDLWKGALGDIEGREEVTQSKDGHRILLASNSLVRISFSCGLRRSVRLAVARYRSQIGILMAMVYVIFYLRNRIVARRTDNARVPMLVSTTLDRLATQAALNIRGDAPESWISIGQLRDDVLRDEFSAKRREAVWRRVRQVVEMNANVRASERELRGGDVSRVWEWIGSTGLMDDAWAEGGRRSGVRFSLDEQRRDSRTPDGRETVLDTSQGRNEMAGARHWDEGRPIY
ncbi:MAG: hypothetical protein Q9174_001239 [Haloplaca sp. 1 TL-2023]